MENKNCLFILFVLLYLFNSIDLIKSQSITVTSVEPPVLVRQSTIPVSMVIVGTNFNPSSTSVKIGNTICPLVSITSTTIECNPVSSGNSNLEDLVVWVGATPSNAIPISRVDIYRIDQYYDGAYWIGSNFDVGLSDKSLVMTSNSSKGTISTTYINSTHIQFLKTKDLSYTTDFGYGTKVIYRINTYWSPLIEYTSIDTIDTPFTFFISGYFFNSGPYIISVGLQSCTNPVILNSTTAKCNLVYVPTGIYQLNIMDSHNQNTLVVINNPVPPINITTASISGNTISFTGEFPLQNPRFLLYGVSPTPIPAKSYTLTSVVFDFSFDSGCGDAYIVDSLVSAATNTLFLCPTPTIQSISKPLTNGGPITIIGTNLSPLKMDGLNNNLCYYFKFSLTSGTVNNGTYNSISSDASKSLQTLIVNAPSGSGTFNFKLNNLFNSSISVPFDLSYLSPYIKSCTSTKFNVSSLVTISGTSFDSTGLVVNIGNSQCSNPQVNDQKNQISCLFSSKVVSNNNDPLEIFINVNGLNTSQYMFLYTKTGMDCPTNTSTGVKCSGNGVCNDQMKCQCNNGWEGMDCSMAVVSSNSYTIQPVVNTNDLSSLMKSPGGNMFDVGLELIREENNNNQLIISYTMLDIKWNDHNSYSSEFKYSGTLPNNATINAQITINNSTERIYYNFAGDDIPILPKSVKYQLEINNWPFKSTLNQLIFIFRSGVEMVDSKDCNQQMKSSNSYQIAGDSVRNVQITLSNGEVLMGTFSDRIMIDERVSYNKVTNLNQNQLNEFNLSNQSMYTMIKTGFFTKNVIVDPNFGVLVSLENGSTDNQECSKETSNKWKLPVIIVCSVVGVGLIVAVAIVVIQKNRIKIKILSQKIKSIKS